MKEEIVQLLYDYNVRADVKVEELVDLIIDLYEDAYSMNFRRK